MGFTSVTIALIIRPYPDIGIQITVSVHITEFYIMATNIPVKHQAFSEFTALSENYSSSIFSAVIWSR